MEAILTLFGMLFLVSLVVEIGKIFIKGMIYFCKLGFLIAILISAFMSLSNFSGYEVNSIGDVCKRIDGCPIVDGICVGCE